MDDFITSRMKFNLKACPFCGTSDPILSKGMGLCWYSCRNEACNVDGPVGLDQNHAFRLWNNRHKKDGKFGTN